jgi:hypothetical protein
VTHVIDDGRMADTRRFVDHLRDVPVVAAVRSARCLTIP